MNILVLTNMYPSPERPAYGIFVKEQIDSLRREKIGIDILFIRGYQSKRNYFKAIWALWRYLGQGEKYYDLIHAHYGLTGWIARLQWKLPVVVTFHGDDLLGTPRVNTQGKIYYTCVSHLLAWLNKILARLIDAVIVQSEEMRRQSGYPRARVIPCGVDFDLFRPLNRMAACQQLGLAPQKRYLLFAGDRSIPVKNFPLAQKVSEYVKMESPISG